MILSPMRFKDFVWPHNPRVYSITYERKVAVHKVPFGRHHLQSLGQTRRVLKGEGEFVGENAYETFSQLANVFYDETPGTLVHPIWVTTQAWFVGLKLEQEPLRDYVRYSFEFWEVFGGEDTALDVSRVDTGGQTAAGGAAEEPQVWHTVAAGDTLWAIAVTNGVSLDTLVALNPTIRNPNPIYVGEKVRVS